MISPGTIWKTVAACAGIVILGYCIYFDHKRRKDPLYFQKLRERRRKAKTLRTVKDENELFNKTVLGDARACDGFFDQQFELATRSIQNDEFEEAVEHFANAFAVHSNPREALKAMQDILPSGMVQLIECLIPVAKQHMLGSENSTDSGKTVQHLTPDDDLE